ncbi:hypothetical protein E3N88_27948 [Mikania micrantha]|uniref:THH1/TOM1/TOM3 domain-containing protein n=1 Tax=Mikania micrantha TaxID=192012 RepID=A0A5N6MZ99_9ASTR|nr:hypothetical protein E3N88_27948 [Mikania micrantha]
MASALRTSFGDLEYASVGGGLLLRLWNVIDESRQWQEGIFYALCAAYALVALIALVQLVRIQLRVPEYGWTTQKVFHLMNFVVNGCKVAILFYHLCTFGYRPIYMILLDLPGLLFFSTYTLLVLFWAEIYHQARSLPADKLRPAYFIVNGAVYFLQVCIWIYMEFSKGAVAIEIAEIFFSVISLCAALGFIIYGGSLFVMLRRFPIESRGRQKSFMRFASVGFVTGICCTCFLIRCVMVAVSAFNMEADVHVRNHPILDLAYYMIVEIIPSALVLFILRKLPPKRVSDHYHPIK